MAYDIGAGLAGLGASWGDALSGIRKVRDREDLASLVTSDNPDYGKAAGLALSTGDSTLAGTLLGMRQTAASNALGQSALAEMARGAGGGGSPAPAFTGARQAMKMPADPEAEGKFISTARDGGLTNPFGLAALAAHANAESGYSPTNIAGSWADPSQSGQPGTSGGALSWRDGPGSPRFSRMREATAGEADPVVAQAKYALSENPDVTAALQNAKSPEEANAIMARSQRFAGWDQPGGENARRLDLTRSYLDKIGGMGGAVPTQTAAAAPAAPAGQPGMASAPDPIGGGAPVQTAMLPRTDGGYVPAPPPRPAEVGGAPASPSQTALSTLAANSPVGPGQPSSPNTGLATIAARDQVAIPPATSPGSAQPLSRQRAVVEGAMMPNGPQATPAPQSLSPQPAPARSGAPQVAGTSDANPARYGYNPPVAGAADPEVRVKDYVGSWTRASAAAAKAANADEYPEPDEIAAAQAPFLTAKGTIAPRATPGATGDPRTWQTTADVPQPVQQGLAKANIPRLMMIAGNPGIPAPVREVANNLLKQAQEEGRGPEAVREFLYARDNGMTQARTPVAYAAEKAAALAKDAGDSVREQSTARMEVATKSGLDPASPEGRRYILTGQMPTGRDATVDAVTDSRARQATQYGLDPASPEGQRYILTGQLPDPAKTGEMKVAEQKMYAGNVEKTNMLTQQIADLEKARGLNPQVYSGNYEPGAAVWAGRNLPFGGMGLVNQDRVTATTQYENLVNGATLSQGKELFGARPTNYDEKLLQALKAKPNMTPQERDTILGQMIDHRKQLLQETADNTSAMKAGTFFRKSSAAPAASPAPAGGGGGRAPAPQAASTRSGGIPSGAVAALRGNPALADQFDAKYGTGASASVLGQGQ